MHKERKNVSENFKGYTTEYESKHLNSSLNSLHVKEKNIRDMQKCQTNRSTLV